MVVVLASFRTKTELIFVINGMKLKALTSPKLFGKEIIFKNQAKYLGIILENKPG